MRGEGGGRINVKIYWIYLILCEKIDYVWGFCEIMN